AAARRALSACQRAAALFETAAHPPEDLRERFFRLDARVRATERWTRLAVALIEWRAELFDGRGGLDAGAAARRCREILSDHGFDVLARDPLAAADSLFGQPAGDVVRDALTDWLALT